LNTEAAWECNRLARQRGLGLRRTEQPVERRDILVTCARFALARQDDADVSAREIVDMIYAKRIAGKSRVDTALGVSMSAAAEAWMNVRRCIEPSIVVSAPIPWYCPEKDCRPAAGSGPVWLSPQFRSGRDYPRRAWCCPVPR
jgi:hypothetical protein